MGPRIISKNPAFTALLELQDEDGLLRKMYPLYSSADDGLPPHDYLKAARLRLQEGISVVVEATDILGPEDEPERPEKWPHPMARPTLALETGSITLYKL